MIKIAWHENYILKLPPQHRFPMGKYETIPGQLLHEGTISAENLFTPLPCDNATLALTHTQAYLEKLDKLQLTASEQRKIGFPQSQALIVREKMITQGTIDCCSFAFENGIALNVAGGTHHAFADRGEGFCILNDMACAANYLLHQNKASKILIIDLDVHQGNGTAKIFEHDKSVFTFSMHGAHNYPFHKEKSDLDIPLKDGIDDAAYLELLEKNLSQILHHFRPDFAFYLSGVDILSTDKFGKLNISLEGCKQRDEYVLSSLQQNNIPVVVAMGGGYSPSLSIITEAHCNTFRTACKLYN